MDANNLTTNLKVWLWLLSFFFFKAGFATTYYVSTTGNDSGSGSASAPFRTLVKAAGVVSAGDTVLVSGGTYSEKDITPGSSGTENAMIVFKPNPGTGDVIIKHPGTSVDFDTPVFQLANRSFIWIEGFQFKDFAYGQASIKISSGEGNVLINNRFENLGNNEVEGWDANSVVWVYKSVRNIVRNNYFYNIYGDGVSINGQGANYNLVCYNTFIGFKGKLRSWGGSNLYSRAIDVQDMSVGNNVIGFNYAEDIIHHIWLDRDGSYNVVLRNFGNTGSGTVFNESRCAHNVIQENISINMNAGFMSAYYETTGWTIEPRWINNVAYKNQTGFNIHKSERDEFRNNIAYNNTDYNMKFTEEALSNAPHIFKNNLWFSDSKTNSIEFKGSAVSVPTFQSGVGETDGLSVNPMFKSISSGSEDFTLQALSPAQGAGYRGVDMGAYAVYGKSPVGCDTNLQITQPLVYFNDLISEADRGDNVYIGISLRNVASDTITVELTPVSGDARIGADFTISGEPAIIFAPGEIQKQVLVSLTDSSEHDELVAFQLTNTVNAQPGARNLRLLRIKKTAVLTAYAGSDQTIRDVDKSGNENVILDGSLSNEPDGTITSYIWSEGGTQIATGENPSVILTVGTHIITLTVTDNDGNTDTDEVIITVVKDSGVWMEAECGTVGSLWNVVTDDNASNSNYVTIKSGNNSTSSAPVDASGLLTYTFDLSESGTYTLVARVICPSPNDDSFWLKMDNGSFAMWNDIAPSSSWIWVSYSQTYNLNVGSHTFIIGYREDGAKLDKLWITNNVAELSDVGSVAGNCGVSAANNEIISDIKIYPNPVREELNIILPDSPSLVSFYNSCGQELFNQNAQTTNVTINMANYVSGIYLIRLTNRSQTIVRKIIKQ